ncbi:unnamed protein product [Ectocarpus sp. 8 AP-2014]
MWRRRTTKTPLLQNLPQTSTYARPSYAKTRRPKGAQQNQSVNNAARRSGRAHTDRGQRDRMAPRAVTGGGEVSKLVGGSWLVCDGSKLMRDRMTSKEMQDRRWPACHRHGVTTRSYIYA